MIIRGKSHGAEEGLKGVACYVSLKKEFSSLLSPVRLKLVLESGRFEMGEKMAGQKNKFRGKYDLVYREK